MGIDPVPGRRVAALRGVRKVVGPGGGRDEGLGGEDLADLARGVGVEEAGGEKRGRAVAEHAPAQGGGEECEGGEELWEVHC